MALISEEIHSVLEGPANVEIWNAPLAGDLDDDLIEKMVTVTKRV